MRKELDDEKGVAYRILTGEERQRLLRALKRDLIAAANGPSSELSLQEVREKGLLAVLRKLAGKKSIKLSFDC
jgi:hypothetical protein